MLHSKVAIRGIGKGNKHENMKMLTILFGYNTNPDSLTGVCQLLAIVVLETEICYRVFTDKERRH